MTAGRLDEHKTELVVCRTATVVMSCRHDPLAATARHTDGRPASLLVQHSVTSAPAAADTAGHHHRLTFDAQSSAWYQQLGPLAERSPGARPTTL